MSVQFEIKKYSVYHHGHKNHRKYRVQIQLYDHEGSLKGIMRFYENEPDIPSDYYGSGSGIIYGYFPLSRYPTILDILRNEGPLVFNFNTNQNESCLQTLKEPVAEGED